MSHFAGFRVTPEPVKGGSGRWSFRKGQVYRFTADFLPAFLFLASRGERGLAPGDLCFSLEGMGAPLPEGEGGLPVSAPGSRYRLEVVGRGNTYFISPRVLYSRETTETYTPKTFYESALAEGAGPCPWI